MRLPSMSIIMKHKGQKSRSDKGVSIRQGDFLINSFEIEMFYSKLQNIGRVFNILLDCSIRYTI